MYNIVWIVKICWSRLVPMHKTVSFLFYTDGGLRTFTLLFYVFLFFYFFFIFYYSNLSGNILSIFIYIIILATCAPMANWRSLLSSYFLDSKDMLIETCAYAQDGIISSRCKWFGLTSIWVKPDYKIGICCFSAKHAP
jgi:hypothetical protein